MDFFKRKEASLYAEDCAISDIVKQHGTPLYIYSRATIERHWHAFNNASGDKKHLVCYAVKANSNIAILKKFDFISYKLTNIFLQVLQFFLLFQILLLYNTFQL